MTTGMTDRTLGLLTDVAIKAPCLVATTANLTLSGLQTVDGVALASNDRVLVKDQTTASENGIYLASTASWTRATDFDGSNDVVTGTIVKVTSGTVNGGFYGEVTTTGTISPGTTSLTIAMRIGNISGVTAFAGGLLDDADAASARTTLGLATIASSGSGGDLTANSVTNAKQAQMAARTMKGNNTAALANAADIAAGQFPATNTNDNAAAGLVGELLSSTIASGSAVSLVSGTAKDVTSISLTAGDWDVWGNVAFSVGGTTTMSAALAWISTTSATIPTAPNNGAYFQLNTTIATGQGPTVPAGRMRLSLASTTTVYLSCLLTFGVSTAAAFGFIGARRVR